MREIEAERFIPTTEFGRIYRTHRTDNEAWDTAVAFTKTKIYTAGMPHQARKLRRSPVVWRSPRDLDAAAEIVTRAIPLDDAG